jgi:hypothetical protein
MVHEIGQITYGTIMNIPIQIVLALACLTPKFQPKVSIIATITDNMNALESFMVNMVSQSIFPQAELIIIDQSHAANITTCLEKYASAYTNIIIVSIPEKLNRANLWNRALKISSAPYLTIAHTQTRRTPNSLQRQIELLEKNSLVDIVYADYCYTDNSDLQWHTLDGYPRTQFPDFKPYYLIEKIVGPYTVWLRSIHEKYGMFNENIVYSPDLELWCRIALAGGNFIKDPETSGVCNNPAYNDNHTDIVCEANQILENYIAMLTPQGQL